MIDLCVIFEGGYLGDGTYPPLHRGQKVNLSFYISTNDIKTSKNQTAYFKQIENSDYSFCGQIIGNYQEGGGLLIIIDTPSLSFILKFIERLLRQQLDNLFLAPDNFSLITTCGLKI